MSRSLLPFLFCFVAFTGAVRAQSMSQKLGVEVTAVLSVTDGTHDLERAILSDFRDELKARNIPETGEYQMRLVIDAREVEIGGKKRIVLSITEMDALPEEVIALGAKEELFYLGKMKPSSRPEEGKFIRDFVSRDWLEQFHSLRDQSLFVIAPEEISRAIEEYVDSLLVR